MKVVAIIPARYESTRLPGKPLVDIVGKTMIERVYERVKLSVVDEVIVATDDARIVAEVESFGGRAMMTDIKHKSGTDRVFEVNQSIGADIVINVQGDEPLISIAVIDELVAEMKRSKQQFCTVAVKQCTEDFDVEDANVVKLVCNKNNEALYFSRSVLPFCRNENKEVLLHWGLYGYTAEFLEKFVSWEEGQLERIESLEQLRALENGAKIKVIFTDEHSIGVDTLEDLEKVREVFKKDMSCG